MGQTFTLKSLAPASQNSITTSRHHAVTPSRHHFVTISNQPIEKKLAINRAFYYLYLD